jgi:hypothetical protein
MIRTSAPSRRRHRFAPALALLPLAGCGGAGDISLESFLSAFAPPAPLDPSVLSDSFAGALLPGVASAAATLLGTDRYDRQNTPSWSITRYDGTLVSGLSSHPLSTSGAAFAHAAGLSGEGSTIAIADYRIDSSHEVFGGTGVTVDSNRDADDPPPGSGTDTVWVWHGTAVASVAAGDSADFVGIAPDADILFGTYATDTELAALATEAADVGAVALNNSWGFTSLLANEDDLDFAFGYPAGQAYMTALATYAEDGVVVFSVPNDNTIGHATLMDGLPFIRPDLEAGWIAAGNAVPTMSGSSVTSVRLISSACYEAARWCLLADGAWEAADPTEASGFGFVTGSSFAAPQISGALALLEEAFPTLDPHALRVRLLASAEDDFFTADDTVELADGFFKGYSVLYGHGFLDIEAALKPIGTVTATTASGAEIDVSEPALIAGTAMGDAIERSLAGTTLGVTDALDAGFAVAAEGLSATAAPRPQAAAMLIKSMSADLARDRTSTRPGNDPFASFTGATVALEDAEGLTRTTLLLPQAGAQSAGVSITRALTDGPTRLELGLTFGQDAGGTLSLGGTAGNSAALMASVSLGLTQSLGEGGWVALSGEVGLSDLGGDTAFGRTTAGSFNSARLEVGQIGVLGRDDRLSVSVGLPVALRSGRVEAMLPVVTPMGTAFEARTIDLAPEARQIDLGLNYQTQIGRNAEVKLSLIRSENFGNIEGRRDRGAAVAFTLRF